MPYPFIFTGECDDPDDLVEIVTLAHNWSKRSDSSLAVVLGGGVDEAQREALDDLDLEIRYGDTENAPDL